MKRRDILHTAMGGALAGFVSAREMQAQEQAARATRGTPSPKIKDVSVIATQPTGVRLVVVKITTDQDGLYGYGCATFTQRADLVVPAVEKYLRPFEVQTAKGPEIQEKQNKGHGHQHRFRHEPQRK
jgi:mannonate dehydratase